MIVYLYSAGSADIFPRCTSPRWRSGRASHLPEGSVAMPQDQGRLRDTIQRTDESLLLKIQRHRRGGVMDLIMKIYTSLGNGGAIWIAASVLMLFRERTYAAGMCSGIALIFSVVITNLILKPFFARPRPYVTMDDYIPLLTSNDRNSFPSGHTCGAFSAGIAWAVMLPNPWLRLAAVAQAVVMGYSRLYVGVHYPSDVLSGTVIGCVCAALACIVM